jgi:2-succinyl-6-hydroxy-2,4-cyclohexadiene-1-carboxylate synthase
MLTSKYQLNYKIQGDLTKPTILFLHGFMGNCEEFENIISLLSFSNKYSFLSIDLPGHGETKVLDKDECYSIERTAQEIIKLLTELKINECFLLGYSMGGRLALYLTLNFSERFKKVILESASPGLPTETQRLERIKSDNQVARKLDRINTIEDFDNFLSAWYNQSVFGKIKNHPHYQQLITARQKNIPSELAKSLRWMGTGNQPSLWEKLKTNSVPLLLLVGEYDEKFVHLNTKIADICEYCDLNMIPGAGHNIHFEQPEIFTDKVLTFLETA